MKPNSPHPRKSIRQRRSTLPTLRCATVKVDGQEICREVSLFIDNVELGECVPWCGYFLLSLEQMKHISKIEEKTLLFIVLSDGLCGQAIYKGSSASRGEITAYLEGCGPLMRQIAAYNIDSSQLWRRSLIQTK